MPDQQKNPLNFWQELKRRKVIRVITVYAATAFVILELVSIIVEPLRLPDWTLQMVIVLLVVGFVISVILSWIYDLTPEGVIKTEPVSKVKEELRETPSRVRIWKMATYVSIIVIIALIAFNIFGGRKRGKDYSDLEKSIAVLHFENLSDNEGQDWFSDGITDVIINQLSKINEFRVLGRTSTIKYKSGEKSISEIGEELGVNYVIEGSVQSVEDQLRIIVQLIRVKNEDHIWSDMYNKLGKNFLSIQNEIALEIAHELNTVLSSREEGMINAIPTENVDAFNLYLQGRYHWNQRSYEGVMKSIDYYKKAIESDPDYALAYSGLADAYMICGDWNYLDPDSAFRQAKSFVQKAIIIDNTLSEAYATLAGVVEHLYFDYELAELFYQQSLKLNPNYTSANQWYALHLTRMGRFYEANKYMDKALELDPKSAVINYASGWMNYYQEDFDYTISQMEKTHKIDPNFPATHPNIFQCYLQSERYKDARLFFEEWMAGPEFREYIKQQEIKNDSDYLALIMNYRLENLLQQENPYLNNIAIAYTHLGEFSRALDILELIVENKATDYLFINVEPAFKEIRSDPRFLELQKKIGL